MRTNTWNLLSYALVIAAVLTGCTTSESQPDVSVAHAVEIPDPALIAAQKDSAAIAGLIGSFVGPGRHTSFFIAGGGDGILVEVPPAMTAAGRERQIGKVVERVWHASDYPAPEADQDDLVEWVQATRREYDHQVLFVSTVLGTWVTNSVSLDGPQQDRTAPASRTTGSAPPALPLWKSVLGVWLKQMAVGGIVVLFVSLLIWAYLPNLPEEDSHDK